LFLFFSSSLRLDDGIFFAALRVLIRVLVTCLISHLVHLMCVVLAGLLLVVGFF
jgi:hypothetical protein